MLNGHPCKESIIVIRTRSFSRIILRFVKACLAKVPKFSIIYDLIITHTILYFWCYSEIFPFWWKIDSDTQIILEFYFRISMTFHWHPSYAYSKEKVCMYIKRNICLALQRWAPRSDIWLCHSDNGTVKLATIGRTRRDVGCFL